MSIGFLNFDILPSENSALENTGSCEPRVLTLIPLPIVWIVMCVDQLTEDVALLQGK